MKKITLFAIAALSFALLSCSKEPIQTEQENDRTFSMTLSASVNYVKATMSDWQFAFATGDKISLTNNKEATGTYYELTRDDDGNFTGDVTAPAEAATWYAYYPSHSVSLAKQTGTKDGTAAIFALAGKQENVPARSRNLNMTLNFQTAILVIEHTILGKKTIDINVKTVDDDKWVSGLAAKNNDAAFDVTKSDTKVSLLTASTVGTYYVVVPAGVKIAVYDGDHLLVQTKSDNVLSSGKYYTVHDDLPPHALPGMFSVSPTKKVFFSKGNLYADASGSGNPVLHFEGKQYAVETSYDIIHVSHFFWAEDLKTAVGEIDPQNQKSLFCDSVNKQSVDGSKSIYYALSKDEWAFLLCSENHTSDTRKDRTKYDVTVYGVNCIVIAPDNYNKTIETSYNDTNWNTAEADGLVCIPTAGVRWGTALNNTTNLYYWTSTFSNQDNAYRMQKLNNKNACSYSSVTFGNGCNLRLVTDCW